MAGRFRFFTRREGRLPREGGDWQHVGEGMGEEGQREHFGLEEWHVQRSCGGRKCGMVGNRRADPGPPWLELREWGGGEVGRSQ